MDYKKRSLAGQAYICDDSLYEEQKKCRKIIQKLNTHDCSVLVVCIELSKSYLENVMRIHL